MSATPARSLRPQLLFGGLAVLGIALIVVSAVRLMGTGEPNFRGTGYHDGAPAPRFTLVDHNGEEARLEDFQGNVVLLFFGFTHCPDVCPLTLSRLNRVIADLGRRADDVRILLVTVDPERDTPDALASYVAGFGDRVIALTGNDEALARVYRQYGVYIAEPSATTASGHAGHGNDAAGRDIAHSSAVYGIDRRGSLRVVIPYEHPEEWILEDVRTLLRL